MSEKSQIAKVQDSKEKCKRHRDNWKRRANELMNLISRLECCRYYAVRPLVCGCGVCELKREAKKEMGEK